MVEWSKQSSQWATKKQVLPISDTVIVSSKALQNLALIQLMDVNQQEILHQLG